jgi:hypothetical protein
MFRNLKKRNKTHLRTGSSTDSAQDDTKYYRCRVCGAICNTNTTLVQQNSTTHSTWQSGIVYDESASPYEPSITKGCWSCGTLESR